MARTRTRYACRDCGHTTAKWMGKCPDCGAWNTMDEELVSPETPKRPSLSSESAAVPVPVHALDEHGGEVRMRTGLTELDNVLGGGLVAGSITLLGGDPGVGKSTLLLLSLIHI